MVEGKPANVGVPEGLAWLMVKPFRIGRRERGDALFGDSRA